MVARRTRAEEVFGVFNVAFLSLFSLMCVYPMVHILFASFSNPADLMRHQGILLSPLGFTLEGYRLTFNNPGIMTGYANTLIYVFVGTGINLAVTSLAAYSLSRKRVLFRNPIMFMIVFTMFFSGGIIPLFLVVRGLGLLNTRLIMVLHNTVSAWNLIVMRTGFAAVPDSLEESAKMDGANDFTVLFRIILPLSKAVVAVMILFYGVGHWNSWLPAVIFLQDRDLYPLQLILREILILQEEAAILPAVPAEDMMYRMLVRYSTVIIATIPILFSYPFLQRYFVKGVMIGSIKG